MPALQPTFQPTWTTERIERLKNRFEAGLSCRQIAADIGVSRNAVIGKLSRLNLTREKTIDLRRRARKSAAKDAVKIEKDLMEIVPRKNWIEFAHLLIFHGRRICKARRPLCEQCVVEELCPSSILKTGKVPKS